jgi:hypothetical protein
VNPVRIGWLSLWLALVCSAAAVAAEDRAEHPLGSAWKIVLARCRAPFFDLKTDFGHVSGSQTAPIPGEHNLPGTTHPLRRWLVGVRFVSSRWDDYQIFEREDAVTAALTDPDRGLGLHVGYRFGRRFLLQLDTSLVGRERDDVSTARVDLMLTGSVLFRVDRTWQPYLVGGLGTAAVYYEEPGKRYRAFGAAAEFGGGFYVVLSRLVSLDVELAGTFVNWQRADERIETLFGVQESDWPVQTSSVALKFGVGLTLWF